MAEVKLKFSVCTKFCFLSECSDTFQCERNKCTLTVTFHHMIDTWMKCFPSFQKTACHGTSKFMWGFWQTLSTLWRCVAVCVGGDELNMILENTWSLVECLTNFIFLQRGRCRTSCLLFRNLNLETKTYPPPAVWEHKSLNAWSIFARLTAGRMLWRWCRPLPLCLTSHSGILWSSQL